MYGTVVNKTNQQEHNKKEKRTLNVTQSGRNTMIAEVDSKLIE